MDAETLLLTLPYYLCSLAAWGTMLVCVIALHKGLSPRRLFFLAASMVFLGVYFFLLAASARAGGYIDRASIAWPLRILASATGVLWLTWIGLFLRATVRVEKHSPAGK